MIKKEFDSIVERRISKIKSTLLSKGKEYSSKEDRLHNFKRAAEIERITSGEALLGMLTKHIVSVVDMVKNNIGNYTKDEINEKVGDCINYLILLEAIHEEVSN